MSTFISVANHMNGAFQIGSALMDYRNAFQDEEVLEKVNEIATARLSDTAAPYKSLIKWQQGSETFKKLFHEKGFEKFVGFIGFISALCIAWDYIASFGELLSDAYTNNEILKNFASFAQSISNFFSCTPVDLIFHACSWIGVVFISCEAVMALVKASKLNDEIEAINNQIQEHPELTQVLEKEIEILTLKRDEAIKDFVIALIAIILFIAANIASGGTATPGFAIAAAMITLLLQVYKYSLHKGNNIEGHELNKDLVDFILKLNQKPDQAATNLLNDCLITAFRELGNKKTCDDILKHLDNRTEIEHIMLREILVNVSKEESTQEPSDLSDTLTHLRRIESLERDSPVGWGIAFGPQALTDADKEAREKLLYHLSK